MSQNDTVISNKSVSNIDRVIGKKIMEMRVLQGMSRQDLAEKLGVSHQQLQKYENGMNRITAGRLYEVANILGCKVSSFYSDEYSLDGDGQDNYLAYSRLMNDFIKIPESQQSSIRDLVHTLAEIN